MVSRSLIRGDNRLCVLLNPEIFPNVCLFLLYRLRYRTNEIINSSFVRRWSIYDEAPTPTTPEVVQL